MRARFVVGVVSKMLPIYHLGGDELVPRPGDPINLVSLYPKTNHTGFQPRSLTAEGGLSELIAFSYPPGILQNGARYGDAYGHQDLERIDDFFDVSLPLAERANLLDAFKPVVDPTGGDAFFVANVWNGNMSRTLVVPMNFADLEAGPACGAYESFGCSYRGYASSSPVTYGQTDGAACFDVTRRIFVGTTLEPSSPAQHGAALLWGVSQALFMESVLSATGAIFAMSGLPTVTACH
jgi:hypothetical protein